MLNPVHDIRCYRFSLNCDAMRLLRLPRQSHKQLIKTHISTHILSLNPFIMAARLYLTLSFSYIDFLRLPFSTFIFRRDSEAPVEAGKSSQGE